MYFPTRPRDADGGEADELGDVGDGAGTVRFARTAFGPGEPPERERTFSLGDRIHWRATFAGPARRARLDVVTVARSDEGWERAVSGHELWLAHPLAASYAGWIDLPAYRGAGTFLLRFIRGDEVIAEGAFEVVGASGAPIVH